MVWNSLFNLLSQQDQVRCFENVAHHLLGDGFFVVETYVLRHDIARQTIEESHVSISSKGVRLNPVVQRYAWPAELDLMARIAGLHLKERWASWERGPFDSKSDIHVSVYSPRAAT